MEIQWLSTLMTNVSYGQEPPHVYDYEPVWEFHLIDLHDCVEVERQAREDLDAHNWNEVYEMCALAAINQANREEMYDHWTDKLMTCETWVEFVGAGTGAGAARLLIKKAAKKKYRKWLEDHKAKGDEMQAVLNEEDVTKIALNASRFKEWSLIAFGWIVGDKWETQVCDTLESMF